MTNEGERPIVPQALHTRVGRERVLETGAQEQLSYYATHGDLTDPGEHWALFEGLPSEPAGLCRVVQGLLIHDHFGGLLYGPPPPGFHASSRETLPVARRLGAIVADRDQVIVAPRPIFARSMGTCRDFALLICAMLRHRAVPARVRCGFARYFDPAFCEDHWVCEYWNPGDGRWAIADAQLDEPHRNRLSIDFDPADVPRDRFVPPWQAWQLCRSGAADPGTFGHGTDAGLWFIRVNLARDLLSLGKREISPWDSWRQTRDQDRDLDEAAIKQCDEIAALAKAACDPSASVQSATTFRTLMKSLAFSKA